MMIRNIRVLLLAAALLAESAHADTPQHDRSRCFGSVSQGRLENASKLPVTGANFQAFSGAAAALGRTHTHSVVRAIALDAYAVIAAQQPELRFVYGEASWPQGGRLRPHRTHQNGLSIDFFVPVRDAAGHSVPIPTSPFTRFGNDLEFDQLGHLGELQIDFEALAEHLFQLQQAATSVTPASHW
ncbi:penicillin-insensitive murein endopeptidase [Aquimonas sp.]|jgi:penicillin-insensitive murein endopeptidase|uniref:penicillin-insensitive murein endopeptidase n=1 Tax=Aquimonas sp. TaxID=1872588 RepID=UPI0037C0C1FB